MGSDYTFYFEAVLGDGTVVRYPSAPGTNLNYAFQFKKGQELYHPHDLLSFYSITEQIIFIQLKILQHFNNEEGV